MAVSCAYHPGQSALSTCVECQAPLCRTCETIVKGKPVCQPCVSKIRARVAQDMGSTALPSGPSSRGTVYSPPQVVAQDPPNNGRLVGGAALGLVIGIVGSILWEKIYFGAHFSLAWFYILIGIGIGRGIVAVAQRGGAQVAAISVAVYLVGMLFGHMMLASDANVTDFIAMMGKFNPVHWFFVAIGAYFAFSTPMKYGD